MAWVLPLLAALIGAVTASFFAVVSFRLFSGEQFTQGFSHCDHCQRRLAWWEKIPVLSYVLIRGRCTTCRHHIPMNYFFSEIGLGTAFALAAARWQQISGFPEASVNVHDTGILLFWLFNIAVLALITIYDIDHMLILDVIVLPACLISLAALLFLQDFALQPLLLSLLSAGVSAAFIGSIVAFTRGQGMGEGDIKLALLIGLISGWPHGVTALFLSFIIGALFGCTLVLLKRKGMREAIPFGPFLSLGAFIALLWGEQLLSWYLNAFIIL